MHVLLFKKHVYGGYINNLKEFNNFMFIAPNGLDLEARQKFNLE